MFRNPTGRFLSVVCWIIRFLKQYRSSLVSSFKLLLFKYFWWNHVLGYTSPLSIWRQFYVGCYSSDISANPVCLTVVGGPGPVGPNGINL